MSQRACTAIAAAQRVSRVTDSYAICGRSFPRLTVLTEVNENIGIITISRRKALNALNQEVCLRLAKFPRHEALGML